MRASTPLFKPLLSRCYEAFLDLVYPPVCHSCESPLEEGYAILCPYCLDQLEKIDPKERCPLCFSQDIEQVGWPCKCCRRDPPPFNRLLSVFDYEGPAGALVRKLKYSNQRYLVEGMAAHMVEVLLTHQETLPDLLIPIPITWIRSFERGYNQSALLAEEMSTLLNCPYQDRLGRRLGDFSQAGLTKKERLTLSPDAFFLRSSLLSNNISLRGKHILLVDDVFTTGTTLKRASEALAAEYPASITCLTFCVTF